MLEGGAVLPHQRDRAVVVQGHHGDRTGVVEHDAVELLAVRTPEEALTTVKTWPRATSSSPSFVKPGTVRAA